MYGWYNQGMGGGWWVLMMVAMLAFWAILIFAIVALVRHFAPRGAPAPAPRTTNKAIEILKERLARGELSEEEFVQRKKLLEGD